MDPGESDLPGWKKELLVKRKLSQSYQRPTDVLEARLPAFNDRALISRNKAADIIKFFNRGADVSTVSVPPPLAPKYSDGERHLADKPGINSPPATRIGMLSRDEGVSSLSQPVRPHRECPTRTDPTHLPPALSTLQTQVSVADSLLPPLPQPTQDHSDHVVHSDIVIIEEDEDDSSSERSLSASSRRSSSSSSIHVTNRYSSPPRQYSSPLPSPHHYHQPHLHQPMGEDKRLFLSNGRNEVDARGLGGVGSRLRSKQVRNVGRDGSLNGGGDSDGMMGSGGESDSSEEIHYGPGFVSRLKSRYMSVALRGSGRGTLGTLRRTASLEDFLEIERTKQEETSREPDERSFRHRNPLRLLSPPVVGNKERSSSRKDSMKRAQSVEVLSILSESPLKGAREPEHSFFKSEIRPPSESPPPLPPREKPEVSNVNLVLNTAPALVNDFVIIAEKPGPPIPSVPQAQLHKPTSSQPRPKYAPGAPKLAPKGPSTGLLFGVKDRELPAPDTVKETRKLFEANAGRSSRKLKTSSTVLTKAKSTSNISSRSSSAEKPNLTKKKSEEDLHRSTLTSATRRASQGSPARRAQPKPGRSSTGSPRRTSTSSPARIASSPARTPANRDTNRPKSTIKTSSPSVTRPAIPAKPSHLSPAVNKNNVYRSSATEKSLSNKPAAKPGLKSKYSSDSPIIKNDKNEMENVRLNLHPITKASGGATPSIPATPSSPLLIEDGIKKISLASIENIRKDAHVESFNFPSAARKSHLPGGQEGSPTNRSVAKEPTDNLHPKPTSPAWTNGKEPNQAVGKQTTEDVPFTNRDPGRDSAETKPSTPSNKQVGVIKPITRETEAVILNPTLANNNYKDSNKQLLVDRPSEDKSWFSPVPPQIPPRNGSKLEFSTSPPKPKEKYFDSNIEAEPSPPSVRREPAAEATNADVTDKSGYRESWKARQDKQNTLVFNFINSKKDVSHIENDGLDISKRPDSGKKGVVILGLNGETNDGGSGDDDNLLNNFTFIGANINTGKSSIRSKKTAKKMNIRWKDSTEVFEYPSFDSAKEEEKEAVQNQPPALAEQNQISASSLKSNTSMATSGGLGSYTPSKIQMTETPFQLGVSKRPAPAPSTAASPPSDPFLRQTEAADPFLRPADTGVSWGRSASSDMLF